MHEDVALVEERIAREVFERVVPLIERERIDVDVGAGPTTDDQTPIAPGEPWGPPWGTTWFVVRGHIPEEWAGDHVAVELDLGFIAAQAGFQCEGLVVDEEGRPVHGVHPRRTRIPLEPAPGAFAITIEAASNPSLQQFAPSDLGSPTTAGERPLYRFGGARLVRVDDEAEALVHDLDVLARLMHALPQTDARRSRLRRTITAALDRLPDVAAMRSTIAPTLTTAGAAGRHTIVATGHAHIDTAWLWPIRETIRKCTRTFSSAVELMDEYPQYRFSCSQAQQYAWIEERHPELFQRITERVDRGQWEPVGGMWVEPDMNLPSGESLVRQIVHGQRYFESRFGRRCTEVWIPDVFGYPASLPQVFAAGGMHRFVTQKLSWNNTNAMPHHTFWWEGLDGTRVLTHFPPVDTYNAEITPGECIESVDRFREAAWSDWSLMPFGYGDGGGGPTAEMLERARRLADLDGAPKVRVGTPAEFFDHVEREARTGAPVPVWRGELYFETHRGTLTSQLRTKAGNRRCERLLAEVEWLAALAGEAAVELDLHDLDELWQRTLTQQFHDILPGSSIAWVHEDAEREHADIAARLDRHRRRLTDRLVPARPHVVNASHVDRDELIEHDGTPTRVHVRAGSITPLAGALRPIDDRVVVSDGAMSNDHLAVRWDATGAITSVISIDHAREVVPVGARFAALEIGPDRPVRYDAWDLESWTPGLAAPLGRADTVRSVCDDGAVGRVRATHSFGESTAVVEYVLHAGSRHLDIEIELDWHEHERLLSIAFPIDVHADDAACDIQFGHVRRPTHASTSWDAAKFEVCAHRYVDVSEPSFGVAVLNDGRHGHGLFDGRIRTSLARAARYPDPGADQGAHRVRFRVLPHGPGLGEVVDEAQRLVRPLRVETGSASSPPTAFVRIDGAGVEIDAVKPADDGSGDLVVRCHEALGDRVEVAVRSSAAVDAAWRCNLLEERQDGVHVADGLPTLTLHPFELVTLRLARGHPGSASGGP